MSGEIITIPYQPRETAILDLEEIHNSPARFRVIVAHRRLGKTTLADNELIKKACLKKGNYFYVAPTYRQAKMISWNIFKHYAPDKICPKKNESELYLEFIHGSRIYLKGSDNPDTLRGVPLDGIIMDEAAYCNSEVWEKILRPSIVDTGGWVIFISTLNGFNWFWDLYLQAEKQENWVRWLLPASQTKVIPEEELKRLKIEMSEASYLQEFECQPQENAGAVFRRIRENSVLEPREPELDKDYVIGVDLAKFQDWTVISVFEKQRNEQVYLDRFQRIDWALQKEKIKAISFKYNNAEVFLDSTGVGEPIFEELSRDGLTVEGIHLTSGQKKAIIDKLAMMLSQDRIKLLKDELQISELEQYQYELTQAGNIRMGAPEGKHDDIVIASALGVWILKEKPIGYLNPITEEYFEKEKIDHRYY